MIKTRRWLALALTAALFLGALAPTAALAYRSDRPTDLPGDPLSDPPLQYGDPEPTGNGSPMQLGYGYLVLLRDVMVDSMRLRLGLPAVGALSACGPTKASASSAKRGARL